jgi:hypothetical protein
MLDWYDEGPSSNPSVSGVLEQRIGEGGRGTHE